MSAVIEAQELEIIGGTMGNLTRATATPDEFIRRFNAHNSLVESLRFVSDKAHKAANGGLRVPGKADSVRDLKNLLRTLRDQANAALALVDSKNGEL